MGGYNRLCLADSFRLHPIQTLLNLGAADGSPGPLVPLHVPLPRASMSEQDESTAPKDKVLACSAVAGLASDLWDLCTLSDPFYRVTVTESLL